MFSKRQAFKYGIWLPFKLYFRPTEAGYLTKGGLFGKYPLVVYLGSAVWMPVGFFAAVLVWGLPNLATVMLLGVITVLFFLVGITHAGGYPGEGYDFAGLIGLGVVLGTAVVILLVDLQAHPRPAGVSWTIDDALIFGSALGIVVCMIVSRETSMRKFLIGSFLVGTGFTAFFAFAVWPETRLANTTLCAIATLLVTHSIFQPVLFWIGLLSGPLARWNPGWAPLLWRISPARWDDFCYVPLPGLSGLVRALHSLDAAAGLQAANRLRVHPFFGRTGQCLYTELSAQPLSYPIQ